MPFSIIKNLKNVSNIKNYVYMANKSTMLNNPSLPFQILSYQSVKSFLEKFDASSLYSELLLPQGSLFKRFIVCEFPNQDLDTRAGRDHIKSILFSALKFTINTKARNIVLQIDSPVISYSAVSYKRVLEMLKSFLWTHNMNIYLYIPDLPSGFMDLSEKRALDRLIYPSDYPSLSMSNDDQSILLGCYEEEKRDYTMYSMSYELISRKERPLPRKEISILGNILDTDTSFSETLMAIISSKGLKDSMVYNKANIDRRHFSKIRTGEIKVPKKQTVLALAIALELDITETSNLLEKAGYSLSRSLLSDVIIRYYIENENYDIYDINCALFEYDQPLLGSFSD